MFECLKQTRRGADKSNSDHSPRATANVDTGVELHPPRNKYKERNTTSIDTIADEDVETNKSYETTIDDVTKRQSGGVGWEDNILYEPSYPTNSAYVENS